MGQNVPQTGQPLYFLRFTILCFSTKFWRKRFFRSLFSNPKNFLSELKIRFCSVSRLAARDSRFFERDLHLLRAGAASVWEQKPKSTRFYPENGTARTRKENTYIQGSTTSFTLSLHFPEK